MKNTSYLKKISTKFILAVGIPTIILISILSVVLFQEIKRKSFDEYSKFAKSITNGIANNIYIWTDEIAMRVKLMTQNELVKKALLNPEDPKNLINARTFLKSVLDDNPSFPDVDIKIIMLNNNKTYNVKIGDKPYEVSNGDVLVTALYNRLLGSNFLNSEYIKQILRGRRYFIGEASFSKTTGMPILPICAAVYDKVGKTIGAISVSLDLDYFSTTYVKGFNFGTGVYTFIADEKKRIISYPLKDTSLNEKFAKENNSLLDNIVNENKYFIDKYNGIKRHCFVATVPISKDYISNYWYIAMVVPDKVITSEAYITLTILIIIYIVFLVIILVGIKFFLDLFLENL